MKWTKSRNYYDMSKMGAERLFNAIASGIRAGKPVNIGLATGNTMIELYEILTAALNSAGLDLSQGDDHDGDMVRGKSNPDGIFSGGIQFDKFPWPSSGGIGRSECFDEALVGEIFNDTRYGGVVAMMLPRQVHPRHRFLSVQYV